MKKPRKEANEAVRWSVYVMCTTAIYVDGKIAPVPGSIH
jgi:hypothetical protein